MQSQTCWPRPWAAQPSVSLHPQVLGGPLGWRELPRARSEAQGDMSSLLTRQAPCLTSRRGRGGRVARVPVRPTAGVKWVLFARGHQGGGLSGHPVPLKANR